MDSKKKGLKKVISNRNGQETTSKNFQIGKRNKHHSSKSVKCDYKCFKKIDETRCRCYGHVQRMRNDRLPYIIDQLLIT